MADQLHRVLLWLCSILWHLVRKTEGRILPGWKMLSAAELKKGFLGSQAWWQGLFQSWKALFQSWKSSYTTWTCFQLVIKYHNFLIFPSSKCSQCPPRSFSIAFDSISIALSSFSQHSFDLPYDLSLLASQCPPIFGPLRPTIFPNTTFEHILVFELPLTSFDSTGVFSNSLRNQS